MKRTNNENKDRKHLMGAGGIIGGSLLGQQMAGVRYYTRHEPIATAREMRALAALRWEMLHKGVTKRHLSDQPAHFNPMDKTVVYDNVRTGLHEMGHSTMFRNSLLGYARRANLWMTIPGKVLGMKGAAVVAFAASGKDGDKSMKKGAVIGAALVTPTIAEEILANAQAARKIISVNGVSKGLSPAAKYLAHMAVPLATYAGWGGAIVGAGAAGGKLREIFERSRGAKKTNK